MVNLNSPSPQTIYIYGGPGTSPVAIQHTEYTLKKLVHRSYALQKIGPEEVIQGIWVKNAALFIMPGGIDVPYGRALNNKGNPQIQTFVQEGGAYLGFCAGAYYASKQVAFAVGTRSEVVKNRELAFFPGVTEGPTLKSWDSRTNEGADASLLQWTGPHSPFADQQTFVTYYNGGGHFVNADTYPQVTILATYSTTSPPKAAIVEIAVGRGRVILSGVHCEFDPKLFDLNDPYLVSVQEKLVPKNHERRSLMSHLLRRLRIKTLDR